jgi:nicotinamide-nucleotide amidase
MALGALDRTGADLAVAVTGVSGPGGGSPAKPIGLTYIAVFLWVGDRMANREASARAAVEWLLERVSAGPAAAAIEPEAATGAAPEKPQTADPAQAVRAAASGTA